MEQERLWDFTGALENDHGACVLAQDFIRYQIQQRPEPIQLNGNPGQRAKDREAWFTAGYLAQSVCVKVVVT